MNGIDTAINCYQNCSPSRLPAAVVKFRYASGRTWLRKPGGEVYEVSPPAHPFPMRHRPTNPRGITRSGGVRRCAWPKPLASVLWRTSRFTVQDRRHCGCGQRILYRRSRDGGHLSGSGFPPALFQGGHGRAGGTATDSRRQDGTSEPTDHYRNPNLARRNSAADRNGQQPEAASTAHSCAGQGDRG